jgi:cell division protein FtsL
MASWSDAAPARPSPRPRARPRPKPAPKRRAKKRGVAGGVVWIALTAVLLTGVVALNVAVLRLNVRLDKLSAERVRLRAEKQALASQLSMAAASPRIQLQARKQLGLVPADPTETTYVRLRLRAH